MKQLNIKEIKSISDRTILYGAGMIGRLSLEFLKRNNINVNYFCDSDERLTGNIIDGLKVISKEELKKLDKKINVFISNKYLNTVGKYLKDNKFENIYDCSVLLEDFDLEDFYKKKRGTFQLQGSEGDFPILKLQRELDFYLEMCKKENYVSSKKLHLKTIDVQITERCSAKCLNCSNLMQYYEKPINSDSDQLFSSIDTFMNAIDKLDEFRVIGGDAFMHKELYKIINFLKKFDTKIIVYTNAKIVPKNQALECLKHPKVIVDITNYGNEASLKHDEVVDLFEKESIAYSTTRTTKWQDCGRILPFMERNENELKDLFHNCCNSDLISLLHGRLYRCPYSANATNLGAVPDEKSDYVDLLDKDKSLAEIRESIFKLCYQKDYLAACSYCNGRDYSTKWIPAAEQTKKRPLAYKKIK